MLFPHLHKFAKRFFGENIDFNYRYPLLFTDNRSHYKKQQNRMERKLPFNVLMHNPNPRNEYHIIRLIENKFKDELFSWIIISRIHKFKIREAIINFWIFYGLSDEDYNMQSAERCWRRSKQCKAMKEREQKDFVNPFRFNPFYENAA